MFTSNTGDHGGAIYSKNSIRFKENSSVLFDNNTAGSYGGAICSDSSWYRNAYLMFAGTSTVVFSNNSAGSHGGAVFTDLRSGYLIFEEKCTTAFSNNSAGRGGAIYANDNLFFKANSTTEFSNNTATSGGALYCLLVIISFEGFSVTVFSNNTADYDGGAISTSPYSNVVFSDNSTVNLLITMQNSVLQFTLTMIVK